MNEFDSKLDEIVQRTGAGTAPFKKDVKKRLRTMWFITISNAVISLLNLLAIRNAWWPENDASRALAVFIFLLSAMLVLMGLIGLFLVWFQGYVYNKMAEHSKNKKS
ncbi:MAG: hypothetical protein Q8R55_02250 [Candidatus Taylorbacteria bacterium]|nr:hypothetical protein [Candidatus Taylorbacteria bacterium]